jgi:ribosome maturation factor RimP
MDTSNIVRQLWVLLEPVLAAQGFEVVDVEFGFQGRRGLLRLFLDREGGITLDDCAEASRIAGFALDQSDVIAGQYVLEVSSPGFDRPVRKPADFVRFTGERVIARTITPIGGRRKFTGTLNGLTHDMVAIDCDGKTVEIHLENLHKVNLDR